MSIPYKYILLPVFILLSFQLPGQVSNKGIPFIKNYTQKEYNAGPQNWSIIQDSRGVMFFGNNYGFLEFDGNKWRLLGIANKTIVRSLAVDKNGIIYIGGQGDFGFLQPDAKGQMSYISLKGKIKKEHQNFDDVWKIHITDEGIAFCSNNGIYYLKEGEMEVYKPESGIFNFAFYVNQRFLVTVKGKGIYELKNNKLYLIPNSNKLSQYSIASILPFGGIEALIITEENGIFTYDGYTDFEPWKTGASEFFKNGKISTACVLSDGFALGSTHNGALIIDKKGNPVQLLNRHKGLQNSNVLSLFQDSSGNLWIGLNNGIDYVEINSPFSLFNAQTGIPGSGYTSLIENGKLYLGTNDGLYYKDLSALENPFTSHPFHLIENSLGHVYNLQKVNNKILLSSHLGPFEIKGNKAYRISEHVGVWKFMPLMNHKDYILCGTYTGLLLYKNINDRLVFVKKFDGFFESSRVMEEDDEGNIWVAHGYKGLYKISLSENLDSISKIQFYDQRHGFPSNLFIHVFKLDNKLIFTGETGYYKYNKQKDRFEEYESNETAILKRKRNGVIDIEKNVFNKIRGKMVGGFEHIAYYDPYNVIIGTTEGFVHYNPSFFINKNMENIYHTLIRKVEITGSEKDSLITGGAYLHNTLPSITQPEDKILILPFKNNSIRFTYSAIAYEDIEKIQYQYFLEGFDNKWSGWTSLTHKEYTQLKEGDYIFHVKAKDIYNNESAEASYKFSINPPWFRSLYAYIGYAIVLVILLYFLKKEMEKRFNKAKQKLKEEQEKAFRLKESRHIEEVLKAEKEIIRLNNEKLEAELIHKNTELTSSAMHVMHSRETILKIREQLETALDNVKDSDANFYLRKVIRSIEADVKFDNKWEQFELHFNQIHQDFLIRLRDDFPELTHKDIKLCAYLRMNLSSKEMAPLLNISIRGIEASRYRIRRKMNLDPEVNLTEYILKY